MLKYFTVGNILRKQRPSVDNAVLHLHYRATFIIFTVASGLVSAKEFFGEPIVCLGNDHVPNNIIDIYCYIMSTFSIPSHFSTPQGAGDLYPGLGLEHNKEIVYHAYYQWVPIALFAQALVFYVPRFIWKRLEGGLFDVILTAADQTKDGDQDTPSTLTAYMVNNMNMHTIYAIKFIFCEYLAFAIVLGNLFFLDYFLGGTFLTFGFEVLSFVELRDVDRVDPMARIFPTVTKCNFRAFGASGSIEIMDTMCVLPINIINQKIYIMLWFWLMCLVVVTGCWILFRTFTILSPHLRLRIMQYRARMAGIETVSSILSKCNFGDWFLLHQLSNSIEPVTYCNFITELGMELKRKEYQKREFNIIGGQSPSPMDAASLLDASLELVTPPPRPTAPEFYSSHIVE